MAKGRMEQLLEHRLVSATKDETPLELDLDSYLRTGLALRVVAQFLSFFLYSWNA